MSGPYDPSGGSPPHGDELSTSIVADPVAAGDSLEFSAFSEPQVGSEQLPSAVAASHDWVIPEDLLLPTDESAGALYPFSEVLETLDTSSVEQTPRVDIDLTQTDNEYEDSGVVSSIELVENSPCHIKIEDTASADRPEAQQDEQASTDLAINDYALQDIGATTVPEHEGTFDVEHQRELGNLAAIFTANAKAEQASRITLMPQQSDLSHPHDSDEEERIASKAFKAHKARYERHQTKDETSVEEDIAFEKAKTAEQTRKHFRQNRRAYTCQQADEESSIFIPESAPEEYLSEQEDEVDMLDTQDATDAPFVVEISDTEPEPKKSKYPKGKQHGKKIGGRVTKSAARTTSGARRGRPKKTDQTMPVDLHDLMTNDPIEQGRANEGLDAQPTLGAGRNKQKALVALIASLPEDQRDLHRGDKNKLETASRQFNGRGAMRADGDKGWVLRGMKSHLHHYQMLGASWMRERENSGNPRGGILGDTMGFGKTVMSLANIVDGKPPQDYREPRATLIIAPSNLISQWSNEIEKHVEPSTFKDRIVYRAGSRLICFDPVRTLGGQDIVITSYNEVLKSYPRNEPPNHLHTAEAKAEWWRAYFKDNRGPLHLVKWYRIILDEAQTIKNYKSITSEAVRSLQGRFRWCLTATPIQNSLDEFWAIMNFLREPTAGKSSYELFKQNFTRKGSQKALERLQVILAKVMLRRTHANKLFDRPVLQLPPIAPVKTIEVKFNNVERQIYKIVRNRFVQRMKMIGGGQQQNCQQMFVLLLRLRQLVGHPLLIQKTLKELMETEDLERLWALTKDSHVLSSHKDPEYDVEADDDIATVAVLEAALQHAQTGNPSTSPNANLQDNAFSQEFRKCLQSLYDDKQWAQANARSLCQACGNPPDNPHITSCHHLYCFQCLNELWYSETRPNGPRHEKKGTCLECGTRFDKCDAYLARGYEEAASRRGTPTQRRTSDNAEENIDWFGLPGPILRSAKIKGAIEQIVAWLAQDKTNKIIVFFQFRGLIKVMARVLCEENIRSVQFDGSMSFDARDEAVKRFSEDPDVPILLAALKAGGIGLNLTAANRVIIMDLWWNFLTESQAFCRAYRIGQTRDVEVVRFVVKDSIDTDMQAMQERKTKEIDSAMEKKNHRVMTVAELTELFADSNTRRQNQTDGQPYGVGEDEPFIFPDDPYDKSDMDSDVEMVE